MKVIIYVGYLSALYNSHKTVTSRSLNGQTLSPDGQNLTPIFAFFRYFARHLPRLTMDAYTSGSLTI